MFYEVAYTHILDRGDKVPLHQPAHKTTIFKHIRNISSLSIQVSPSALTEPFKYLKTSTVPALCRLRQHDKSLLYNRREKENRLQMWANAHFTGIGLRHFLNYHHSTKEVTNTLPNSAFSEELSVSTTVTEHVSTVKIRCSGLYVSLQLPLWGISCYNSCICSRKREGASVHLPAWLFCLQHQEFNAHTSVVRLTTHLSTPVFPKLLKLSTSTKISFICTNTCLHKSILSKS